MHLETLGPKDLEIRHADDVDIALQVFAAPPASRKILAESGCDVDLMLLRRSVVVFIGMANLAGHI